MLLHAGSVDFVPFATLLDGGDARAVACAVGRPLPEPCAVLAIDDTAATIGQAAWEAVDISAVLTLWLPLCTGEEAQWT
jgi:hypothetical protein